MRNHHDIPRYQKNEKALVTKEMALSNLEENIFIGDSAATILTEVWHMAHFWVSYGRCTMPGSPMGRSEGSSRRWTG